MLALGSCQTGAFDDATLARLQPLADAVALAFENVRLFQKTRELSITDEVTPLHNFRYFHQALERELKLVNRYGGDAVAAVHRPRPLQADQRPVRPPARQPHAARGRLPDPRRGARDRHPGALRRRRVRGDPAADGRRVGPRPRREAARLVEGHTFLQEEGINARLGVSLGLATYPAEANTKEALIRLADKRMYEDKESRRTGR